MKTQHPNNLPPQSESRKPTADRRPPTETSDRASSRLPRISWGTGIALLYIGFVVGMLTLVTMSMNQKVDLVTEDYYALELGFQKKIDKVQRANALAEPLRWEVTADAIKIQYPSAMERAKLTGKVIFYCPSDNQKDSEFNVLPDAQNQQSIPLSKLQSGRYKLQFDWKDGETTFWNEGVVTIQN